METKFAAQTLCFHSLNNKENLRIKAKRLPCTDCCPALHIITGMRII